MFEKVWMEMYSGSVRDWYLSDVGWQAAEEDGVKIKHHQKSLTAQFLCVLFAYTYSQYQKLISKLAWQLKATLINKFGSNLLCEWDGS